MVRGISANLKIRAAFITHIVPAESRSLVSTNAAENPACQTKSSIRRSITTVSTSIGTLLRLRRFLTLTNSPLFVLVGLPHSVM